MATTGPFSSSVIIPGLLQKWKTGYKQKPITDHPLNYYVDSNRNVFNDAGGFGSFGLNAWEDPHFTELQAVVYQKAYGRLLASVSTVSAQLGASFAERKQAMSMMVARVAQLTSAARALKTLNISGFIKALGCKRRTVRKTASDAGGVWLEYSYGWKPLVEDIYSAVNVLQLPLPSGLVRGKAQGDTTFTVKSSFTGQTITTIHSWKLRRLLQMRISLGNYVAWQANELGLTNPLAIAWEVIPFSFAVDWFLPIGKYLQSLTDFVGLNQTDAFVTKYDTYIRNFHNSVFYPYTPLDEKRIAQRLRLWREVGSIPTPKLRSRFTGFYSARGANAIALLTSTLKDLPKIKTNYPAKGRSLYV